MAGHGRMKKWKHVLRDWDRGIAHTYPTKLMTNAYENKKIMWNTSVLTRNGNVPFVQKFKVHKNLPSVQNFEAFNYYIDTSRNKYVTSFPTFDPKTVLVIPMPVDRANFATFRDFIDNASQERQILFWKRVSKVAKKQVKKYGKVWISTHGLGVPYLHVRVSSTPKYYFDRELARP